MSKTKIHWYKYAAPVNFYPLAGKMIPFFTGLTILLFGIGLYMSFFVAPAQDFQQHEYYRIIFIHVPAAWIGMFLYVVMAIYAGVGWAFNARLASMMATAIAPTGAIFTFISLVTGSLWGRPAWNTYWAWDARMTSTLILMFLYIGFISLQSSIDDTRRADRAGAVLALVGVINVPIIYFSVKWWSSLHQTASLTTKGATMPGSMLVPMLILTLACWMYSIAVVLVRVRCIILERERESPWLVETAA